jgi:hypothetical protein
MSEQVGSDSHHKESDQDKEEIVKRAPSDFDEEEGQDDIGDDDSHIKHMDAQ